MTNGLPLPLVDPIHTNPNLPSSSIGNHQTQATNDKFKKMLEPHVKSYDYFCNEALTAMGNDNGGIPRYNVEIFENKRDAVKPEVGSKGKLLVWYVTSLVWSRLIVE